MKKFLVLSVALVFLLMGPIMGPVSADWVDDLKPLPMGVTYISVKFQGDTGIVVIETRSGSCMEYRIVDNEIAKMRSCGDAGWKDFVKK